MDNSSDTANPRLRDVRIPQDRKKTSIFSTNHNYRSFGAQSPKNASKQD